MAEDPRQVATSVRQDSLLDKTWVRLVIALGVLVALALIGYSLWLGLRWYLRPNTGLTIVQRKDLVQGLASVGQALAVGLTGAAGFIGLLFTWRNLRQARESTQRTLELTEQGQITERFTRAIDQLGTTDDKGKKKLEIRLGGIYALERIDKESPKRAYHGTVMEVLTAYVRENSRWEPKEASTATLSTKEDTEREKEGFEQDAESTLRRRLPADIRAILVVLKRREEDSVPEEHRVLLDLQGADLQGADLQEANLQEAILCGSNLQGTDLQGADLQEANLQGAILWGSNLQEARLRGADFREANLQKANILRATLRDAKLLRANLQEATLQSADLQGANLLGANLQEANFLRANLQEASLLSADLKEANLQGANLQEAYFQEANLRGALLRLADLQEASFLRANLQGANLQKADLRGTNLPLADLQGANLQEANLQGAKPRGANLQETNLQETNLQGARLRGADLRGADLRGADLQEASLLGANLQGANLRGTKGLDQKQIERAIGDNKTTLLPEGLHPPEMWGKSAEEQFGLVHGDL
jgi:uncharacterized protein YjbI with pentapeptide repeats